MDSLIKRITSNPDVCNGKPAIRNMRFTVNQMLELLASGMTNDAILGDYPFLEKSDIDACLIYAAQISNTKSVTIISDNA